MSVFSWGKNAAGQLGVGDVKDRLDPTTVEGFRGNIVDIASGEEHTLAINELGALYVWGRVRDGQHGLGSSRKDKFLNTPVRVDTLASERIVSVACGSYHCLALNAEGEVYEWGMLHRFKDSNEIFGGTIQMPGMESRGPEPEEWEQKRKQMIENSFRQYYSGQKSSVSGKDKETVDYTSEVSNFGNFVSHIQSSPVLVEGLSHEKIVHIAAGYAFSVAVAESGRVYAWGFNDKRQLGLGFRYNQERPHLVKALKDVKIVKVSCGQQHTLALADDGKVYSWGLGIFGQLGHGNVSDKGEPALVDMLSHEKITQVTCGAHHSLALTDDGRVYTWGSSEYGQQASKTEHTDWQEGEFHSKGERKHYFAVPRVIPDAFDNKKVAYISCGSLHSAAVTEDGHSYTWGWGINGQLGHGNRRYQQMPTHIIRLAGEKVTKIVAGNYSTVAMTASGATTFAYDFKNLVNQPIFSDLLFTINGKKIHAHKSIVYSRCPTLKQMILDSHNPPPAPAEDPVPEEAAEPVNENEVEDEELPSKPVPPPEFSIKKNEDGEGYELQNTEFYVFLAFLRYLYTDHLTAPEHHVPKVRDIAEKLQIERLKALCHRFISLRTATKFDSVPNIVIPSSTFSKELAGAVNDPHHSDIKFVIPSHPPIYGHRALLISRSDYFRKIFEGGFKESKEAEIEVHETTPELFLALLKFMYTNEFELPLQNTENNNSNNTNNTVNNNNKVMLMNF
eukprot:TRINITY_DN275_c0_g1_i10.p1 TRINITY_DN275_c0_g1~~TRINITY_DN275_c0_g1_i10.p1  ORF type:complete len:731 (+),score=199.22 TRINITY_DN275_c0_g1_i10:36-2228(+)